MEPLLVDPLLVEPELVELLLVEPLLVELLLVEPELVDPLLVEPLLVDVPLLVAVGCWASYSKLVSAWYEALSVARCLLPLSAPPPHS